MAVASRGVSAGEGPSPGARMPSRRPSDAPILSHYAHLLRERRAKLVDRSTPGRDHVRGVTGTRQISRAYPLMVSSLEKRPIPAMFRSAMRAHRFGSL